MATLRETVERNILSDLQGSLANEARRATFALWGSIPINTSIDHGGSVDSTSPVQVRFGENGRGVTLTLPSNALSPELHQLLAACAPAPIGRGEENVLDETYREAGKLETTEFSSTFCPYTTGTMDVVQQVLMPHSLHQRGEAGLRAELHKLNVYSAPGGHFKPHVDTPRSDKQVGSLVVALPLEHQGMYSRANSSLSALTCSSGGELVVRHGSKPDRKEQVFDWS